MTENAGLENEPQGVQDEVRKEAKNLGLELCAYDGSYGLYAYVRTIRRGVNNSIAVSTRNELILTMAGVRMGVAMERDFQKRKRTEEG